MAYKIIKEDEELQVDNIIAVIYGEPGIGKTSLTFTSDKPILFDYDDGLKRAVGRKTAIQFESWEDSIDFIKSDDFNEMKLKTLIFDTAGTMLDNYIAKYAIKQDFKNARGGGEISLQGYGAIKNIFNQFVSDMKTMKIDVIFIAHEKTKDDGDGKRKIPKMTGGSFDILIASSDMVGYINSSNNKRTINFNPTDTHIGKNTAQFPIIDIPHYEDAKYKTFMADLISQTKTKMMDANAAQQTALKKLNTYRDEIKESKNTEDLELILPAIETMSPSYKVQLHHLFDENILKFGKLRLTNH